MALRVLLADESSTIKRVIQLALQDYAVEVKSVPVGLDVIPVARSFKPDLVFADVLLPKRNGYEVCGDLKKDPETKTIPVVLMWSGFMDLDDEKARQCLSDGRLEKPFETDQLRTLVQNLIPKTRDNPVSSYLRFPKLPEFAEKEIPPQRSTQPEEVIQYQPLKLDLNSTAQPQDPDATLQANAPAVDLAPVVDLGSFEIEDEPYQQVPLHKQSPQPEKEEISWTKKDLSQFKLNLNNEDLREKMDSPRVQTSGLDSFENFEEFQMEPPARESTKSALDLAMAERILREEAQKAVENMIWKILPEITEKIVQREINKLLLESEKTLGR